jgi:tRNA(Ile)-lysidine synthase
MSPKQVSVVGRFLATIEKHSLIPRGSKVLAAVSGGADSVALLDLLRSARDRLDITIAAFHLNHGLRERASRDEAFVRKLCKDWRIELVVVRADVAGYAKRRKLGIEEAGRELRYERLERAARRLNCTVIAFGHTANDNLETMLLNLARGAGARGLAGIPVRRGPFVRPLLDIERQLLERHLRARRIGWTEDESNQDVKYRRNLIRHEVVPVLLRVNPGCVASARKTAQLLAEEDQLLDVLAAEATSGVSSGSGHRLQIDIPKFRNYNNILRRRVLRQLLPELDLAAVERVLDFCDRETGGRLELTDGVRARRHIKTMEFERGKEILDNA